MEKTELRIGNYYQNKSNDLSLKFQRITFFEDAHYVAIYCDPIPLTEEWLVKMGANIWGRSSSKMAGLKLNENTEFEVDLINGDFHIIYNDLDIDGEHACIEVKIKHVHQLQNLYFALTGTELEIK